MPRYPRFTLLLCGILLLADCVPPPGAAARYAARHRNDGVVEGYVRDARTGKGLPGQWVLIGVSGKHLTHTYTNENGFYTASVPPWTSEIYVMNGDPDLKPTRILVHPHQTVRAPDVLLAHVDEVTERDGDEPSNCPGSPPGAVVEGHTTSQADIDDLVVAVLNRFVADPSAIPDHGLLSKGGVAYLNINVRDQQVISPAAIKASPIPLVGKSYFDLQDLADSTRKEINFIDFSKITSDGSCAFVHVGVDFTMPRRPGVIKMCCCTALDVYEKRTGRWVFVRNDSVMCE
jgi:hypothetical protein